MWKISIDAEIFGGSGFATSESISPVCASSSGCTVLRYRSLKIGIRARQIRLKVPPPRPQRCNDPKRKRYQEGVRAYDASKWDIAIDDFQQAKALDSASTDARLDLAMPNMQSVTAGNDARRVEMFHVEQSAARQNVSRGTTGPTVPL
jgi:hypothetical protein